MGIERVKHITCVYQQDGFGIICLKGLVAKAILKVIRSDILDAAGSIQLCTGQTAVTEAAVHAMNQAFQANEAENVLLVDVETFRKYLVHGPRINLYINIYRQRGQFVQLGDSLSSKSRRVCIAY